VAVERIISEADQCKADVSNPKACCETIQSFYFDCETKVIKILRTKRFWHRSLGISIAGLLVCIIVPSLLSKRFRWCALNPQYSLWKYSGYGYSKRLVYEGLNGDIFRDEVVSGKTLPELRTMFIDIRELSEFDPSALAKVSSLTNSTRSFIKWGETDWFIELKNGRATSISLWKG
jgi:hypothetical protein